jgi:site-specific DNA recombinase
MNVPLLAPQHIPSLLSQAATIKETLTHQTPTQMAMLIDKVMITDTQVDVAVSVQAVCKALKIEMQDVGQLYTFTIPAKLTRSGVAMKLVQTNGQNGLTTAHVKGAASDTLLKTIARGHKLWQRLKQDNITLTELAAREGVTRSYVSRILMLAFLDPWIIEQIIESKQPAHLDLGKLTKSGQLPMQWNDQRAFAGFTKVDSAKMTKRYLGKRRREITVNHAPNSPNHDSLGHKRSQIATELGQFSHY